MTLTVEVAFDVQPGTEPAPGDWTDISSRVAGLGGTMVTVDRGANRGGTGDSSCRFKLDNYDRGMSPDTLSSEVLVRHCRLTYDSLPLFRGYTARWRDVWSFNEALIDVRLVDVFARLAQIDQDVDLPRQKSGARINALLDLANIPAGLRDVDAGRVWLEAYEQTGANLRRSLEDVADAEDGQLTVARDGTIQFRSRHDRLNATAAATLRGTGTASPGDLPVAEGLTPTRDTDELANVARVELDDGTVHQAQDDLSIAEFGEWDLPVRDLAMPGYQAEALANWIVIRYAWPNRWMDGVPVDLTDDTAGLTVGLGDLVEFIHAAPGGGSDSFEGHVERVRDDVDVGRLLSTWWLSPYFGAGPWLVLGDATDGQIGTENMIGP